MAIYRGDGGSLDGLVESEVILIAISQGGTGASTAAGARTNLGLGSAAATDTSAYATAAQGALADTATQPDDLGTAAAEDVGYFATAAQGALADSAVQPGDLATVATSGSYNDLTDKPSAGSGTVTSVAMSVPTGLSVSGSPVTTTGTLAVTYSAGYSIPTTANQTNWSTAYGWGNHASAGYLTSETYTGTVTSVAMSVPTGLSVSGTPITGAGTLAVTLSAGYSIPTTASQTNWDTAYGWGNHASAGYAADSAVVHNTGTETVAGAKTFSTSVTSPIITASTKFVSSYFDASGSGGGALRNASGTSQLQWGGGGGNNITFDVAANLNPANSQIDISPTGTGTVRINPATLSSMNNVTIGATTAAAITGTTITATTYAGGNTSNWDTAYTDRLKWDGGSTGLTASTGRTSLGATTVGGNLFTLTNPSAVTFVRLNADNTVSALSASDFRTAIGAGTSSTTGTVTSVGMTVPTGLSVSGTPVTSSGTLAVTLTSGYSIPTTTSQTNWDTAYGWGNHASAGYLTSSSTLDASKLSGTIDGGTY